MSAFCEHAAVWRDGAFDGPLRGRTFAVKDVFAVRGVTACFGNPTWLATHEPAERDARAVAEMLAAGATLTGVTLTDELALSLTGENAHYGTPRNPRCPDRVPGGSSSGSAAAVAAGLVDFALGTDTGGSVRVPASHCGLHGFRPSHGAVSTDGVLPLAPRFDTVGWLAKDARTLARVGDVLLPTTTTSPAPPPRRLLFPRDVGPLLDPAAALTFERTAAMLAARLRQPLVAIAVNADASPLVAWTGIYLALQNAEAAAIHGAWLRRAEPRFGSLIAGRVAGALAQAPAGALAEAEQALTAIQSHLACLVTAESWLVWPSAVGAAPLRGLADDVTNAATGRALALGALASFAGLPQVSLPLAEVDGCPFGISLIAPRGADRALLASAAQLGMS
jgi:amidase